MGTSQNDISDRELYKRLLKYVLPDIHIFLLALFGMVLQAVMEPAKAALLGPMLDQLFIQQDRDLILIIPGFLVLVFAISGLAAFIGSASIHWVANKVVMDLRYQMFNRVLNFPSATYDRQSGSSLVSKFTYDVIQIKTAASGAITTLIKDTLMIIGLLAWMFYVEWVLTCIALIGTPLVVLIVYVIRSRLRRMSSKAQETMADINHILNESIVGQRIVKLFGGQKQERDRFKNIINANRHFEMKFVYASAASGPIVQLIAASALAVIVYVAANQSFQGQLSLGEFGSFMAAMVMLMDPLKRLVKVNEHIQRGLAGCESVFAIIDEKVEEDTGEINVDRLRGEIEISNLNFSYGGDENYVLKDINIHIEPGETIALVGISGSGKSTLANLIPRFYQLEKGSIRIDGHDIHDMSLTTLRDNIALVSQEILLFNDTIKNNIAYGKFAYASEADIVRAAKSAHAMEFIEALPEGLNTVVGDRGTRLSGGQRQRIALARALLKNAPILILDEATSSLDNESERKIRMALEEIRQDRTCLIIAHRLSTIENADSVIVMDRGRIIESGTHSELLEKDSAYARLYLQTPDN